MFFTTILACDGDRDTKREMDGLFRIKRPKVFQVFPATPGIGFQSQWDDGDAGSFGQFYGDTVKLLGIEDIGTCALGENNDRVTIIELLYPLRKDCGKILSGIDTIKGNGIAGSDDTAKDWKSCEAFFDDNGHFSAGAYHSR